MSAFVQSMPAANPRQGFGLTGNVVGDPPAPSRRVLLGLSLPGRRQRLSRQSERALHAAGNGSEQARPSRGWRGLVGAAVTAAITWRPSSKRTRLATRIATRSGSAAAVLTKEKKTPSFTAGGLIAPNAFDQWTGWRSELGAGLTTAVVALPLAMAFGVASGAGALAGIYGAIFTGFFASLFGGTPAQVTGPTGPMTVVMAGIILKTGNPAWAFACVALAGVIQVLMGLLRLGGVINLVPVTVLSGFMTGVGGIICSLQLPVMFGYSGGGTVVKALATMPKALAAPNVGALIVGATTLLTVYKFPDKYTFQVPKPLIALLLSAFLAMAVLPAVGLGPIPMLGAIPFGLPRLMLPQLTQSMIGPLLSTSMTLAVLGAIDSLLTSLVSDSLTSSFHDSNRELIGQGIGNSISGLFGGSAGAGATMRTVVNVRTGGRTPVSGAFHSVVLLVCVLGLGPLASYVPLACLAGILIKSGLDVVDWKILNRIQNLPRRDIATMAVTFYLTMFVDLIVAVLVGWVAAIFIDFYDSSTRQLGRKGVETIIDGDVATVNLRGAVTFGAATGLLRILVPQVVGKKTVFLDMSLVNCIDTSAVLAFQELCDKIKAEGGTVYMCGLDPTIQGARLPGDLGLVEAMGD